jgi:formylglycine-generating enzyme required for sulfatase activity
MLKLQRHGLWVAIVATVTIFACWSASDSTDDSNQGELDAFLDTDQDSKDYENYEALDNASDDTNVETDVDTDAPNADTTQDPKPDTGATDDPTDYEDPDIEPYPCDSTVMTQNIEAIATVIQQAKTIYQETYKPNPPYLREKAVTDVIAYLQSHDSVSQVEASSDGSAIYFTWEPGIRCSIYIKTMLDDDAVEPPWASPPTQFPTRAPGGNGKAAIYSTLADVPGFQNSHRGIAQLLSTAGFQVEPLFEGPAVTLDAIGRMSEFDVIYIRVHGNFDRFGFNFMTGESPSGDICKYGSLLVYNYIGLGATLDNDGLYFTVYPRFFRNSRFTPKFNFRENSLAYFSASDGLLSTCLASQMRKRGLGAFVGWSGWLACADEDAHTNIALFERLLQGASLGVAIAELGEENERFGQTLGWEDFDQAGALLGYYPGLEGGQVRITSTGCDKDSDCPQDPEPLVCINHQCIERPIPECAGRVCGPDPVCGESCGSCANNMVCDLDGKCSAPSQNCSNGWCLIPAGSFKMGSSDNEPDRFDNEGPVRFVTITRPFYMKQTEVTQGEWQAVMTDNPSHNSTCGNNCPVEQVSWFEAVNYANTLSRKEFLETCYEIIFDGPDVNRAKVTFKGLDCKGYRLPTEAEWEYAARAGATGPQYGNIVNIAWYSGNSSDKSHPVKQKTANAWGLNDVLGNVEEWVYDSFKSDYYSSRPFRCTDPIGPPSYISYKVVRGGAYNSATTQTRLAYRNWLPGDTQSKQHLGFRLVRTQ